MDSAERKELIEDMNEAIELVRQGGDRTKILAIGMAMGARGLQELNKALQGA